MSDSEEDIFSMATVPLDNFDSSDSIYDKETQPLEDITGENSPSIDSRSYKSEEKFMVSGSSDLYEGPTQPLKTNTNSSATVNRRNPQHSSKISPIEGDKYDEGTQPLAFNLNCALASRRISESSTDDDLYEGPTQPLHTKQNSQSTRAKNKSSVEEFYDGPTQPLILKSTALPAHLEVNDSDSDCDTIPASPVFLDSSLNDEVEIQGNNKSSFTCHSEENQTYCQVGGRKNSGIKKNSSENIQDALLVDSPTQFLDSPKEANNAETIENEDRSSPEFYDGPTQPLRILSTKKDTSPEKPSTSSSGRAQSDFEDCDTLPLSPLKNLSIPEEAPIPHNDQERISSSQTSDMDIEEESDETQVFLIQEPGVDERGISSVSTIAVDSQKDEADSDKDTLPCSPVAHVDLYEDIPSTQSNEAPGILKASDTLTALNTTGTKWDDVVPESCPLSPDLFSDSTSRLQPVQNPNLSPNKNSDCADGRNPVTDKQKTPCNDSTLEMDRETLPPNSPVFDFDDSETEETQVITPSFRESPEMLIAETPFVPETPFVARSPSLSGTSMVAETPFINNVPDLTRKRNIIRRSAKAEANQSKPGSSTPAKTALFDSNRKEEDALSEAGTDNGDSDFELSFASHYSALPSKIRSSSGSSSEPFVGFDPDDMQETSNRLREINQVIGVLPIESEKPANDATPLDQPSAPDPTAGPSGAIVPKSPLLPAPRRSSRKPMPNTRRTSDHFQLSPQIPVTKRRPGRPPKVKVEVELSTDDLDTSRKSSSVSLRVSEPSESGEEGRTERTRVLQQKLNPYPGPGSVTKRRRGRQTKMKVEIESSDESDVLGTNTSVAIPLAKPPESDGNQSTGRARVAQQKLNSHSGPESTTKRRPGRPPKGKVEIQSSDESDATRKSTSVSLPITQQPESGDEQRTGRTRIIRQKVNSLPGPAFDVPGMNSKARQTAKRELSNDVVPDEINSSSAALAPRRQTKRSVNNNNADSSSVGSSSSPSVETSRRKRRALAGQV